MNTDTLETEKLTDADFKNIDEDMETATLQAYNRLHDLCADMERERNQARKERDDLKETLQLVWKHLKGERIRHDYITGTSEAGDLKTLQQVCEEALTAKKGGDQ